MGICTINTFRTALQFSDRYISLPKGITPHLQSLTRSKHFVECEAVVGYTPVMIYAPISGEAMRLALVANQAVAAARGDILHFGIHHNALRVDIPQSLCCSIIVEELPEGYKPLRELLYFSQRTTLISALEVLRSKMIKYDISHNNLHIDNIVVDEAGAWHLRRLYYATRGAGGDEAAFDALRIAIADNAMSDAVSAMLANEELSSYDAHANKLCSEPLIENRRRFSDKRGYGFMDEKGSVVIEPRYSWAEHFAEGRAMVRDRAQRAGMIDRNGREIIPLIYDNVIFSAECGTVWVERDELWVEFDYNGKRIGEWRDMPPFSLED